MQGDDNMRLPLLGFAVFFGFLLVQNPLFSQNIEDAVRFSAPQTLGTARFVGMAGSFGALGGEASAVNSNPAGIGVFRTGQFTASLTIGQSKNSTTHYGSESEAVIGLGRLSNFSIVLSEEVEHPDWEFVNAFFSYNQQSMFTTKSKFEGVNNQSSLLDLYFLDIIEDPNVTVESVEAFFPFGAGLAWGAFLIDTANGEYIHANELHGQTQGREDQERRGIGHYNFGVGGNYRDKLHLGASIGVSALRYSNTSTYSEVMPENNPNTFVTSWKQTSELNIRGNGFQLKMGAIYRINKILRMGASFKSQEFFKLSETYTNTLVANWEDRPLTSAESPEGLNDYRMRSPYTLGLSFGAAKKKIGAINIDVDYIDYRAIQFKSFGEFPVDFTGLNNELSAAFKPTFNFRSGIEKPIGPYTIRAGYSFNQGIENTTLLDRHQFGLGFGYRRVLFAFDIRYGYAVSAVGERYIHFAENINLAASQFKTEQHQVVLSFAVYLK